MRLALFQPDIPQNVGAIMRLCACMDVPLDVIEPCSFPWNERKIRESAMDYANHINPLRHADWAEFQNHHAASRIVLLSTKAAVPYTQFSFQAGDILLAGSESAGVPDYVHEATPHRIIIPMQNNMRSLNVGMACAIVLGEAIRQVS